MSTLAIAAAHLAGLPARYAVGRWSNIPINTLLVYNAADLGLNILVKGLSQLGEQNKDTPLPSDGAVLAAFFVIRTVFCLTAVYVTSKLTEPMPLKTAALTNLAASVSIVVAMFIFTWGKEIE